MPSQPQLYNNPACSKCRTAVALLEEHRVQADTIALPRRAPDRGGAQGAHGSCSTSTDPRLMMRTGEAGLRRVGDWRSRKAMRCSTRSAATRYCWSGPIFVVGDRAVIARPPERLLELL